MTDNNTQSTIILNDVLDGRKEFLELDFKDPLEREIAVECIKAKEEYIYLLDADDKDQKNILLDYVALAKTRENKYERIFKLLRKQLNKDILDIYLGERFEESKEKFADSLDVYRGYTSSLILSYDYETKQGETLCYFDKSLGIPAKLCIKSNFKLKLVNSLLLVKKLDIAISAINLDSIINMLNNELNTLLRDTVLNFVEENNLTFFELSKNYTKLSKTIVNNAEESFGEFGIEVADLSIKDISLSNNAGKMLEEQYFAIAEAERVKEFEHRIEETSLDFYEKKAIIHSKYPSFPVSLTEAEKDFAFDRFLRKENKGRVYSTKLDEIKLATRNKPEKIVREKPQLIVPKEPNAPKMFKGLIPYAILFALFVIGSLIAMFMIKDSNIGLYALIGSVVIFGAIGVVLFVISSKRKGMYPSKKEYKKLYEEYEKELEQYQEKKNEENAN